MTLLSSTATRAAALALLLTGQAACAIQQSPPIAIQTLTERDYPSSLEITRKLGEFDGYSSYAVAWEADGLRLTAVMNVPGAAIPDTGYPVLIMNHGNANDRWDTFKAYYSEEQDAADYRALPMSGLITRYAREGFVVVFPDYRGHGYSETNGKSEGHWQLDRHGNRVVNRQGEHVPRLLDDDGLRFGGWLYTAHYTIDVLHLINALASVKNSPDGVRFDYDNLFLWGRSLGGDVTARAMTVSDRVAAASLWVPATMSLWDQAHHYHYDSPCCADGFSLEALFVELQKYNAVHETTLVARDLNPANFIEQVDNPVMIQVSIDDTGVRSAWGIQYHYALREHGVPSELRVYDGSDHVFKGDVLEQAIRADLAFFRSHMQ
jgi:dienelactone hydrolase